MKRKVIRYENYIDSHANGTRGSNILYLECGHTKRQKGSVKIPKFCRCNECDNIKSCKTATMTMMS